MRVHTVAIAVAVFVSRCAMADAQELRGKITITILYYNTVSHKRDYSGLGILLLHSDRRGYDFL